MPRSSRRTATTIGVPAIVIGTVVGAVLAMAPTAAGAPVASVPPYHPTRLAHLGDARQVIVVTASSWSTSHARLRTYRQAADGTWHEKLAPKRARLGWNGFAGFGARRQNSGETPAGTFRLVRAFGSLPDPGTDLRYRRFDRNDWWPYDPRDPRTYNVYQFSRPGGAGWRSSWAEHLWDFRDQYRYAVVLRYNLPRDVYRAGAQRFARTTADTRAGGGIFLHVTAHRATAGCVAVGTKAMRRIVRWLDPDKHPVIVMAPRSAIGRA